MRNTVILCAILVSFTGCAQPVAPQAGYVYSDAYAYPYPYAYSYDSWRPYGDRFGGRFHHFHHPGFGGGFAHGRHGGFHHHGGAGSHHGNHGGHHGTHH